MAQGQLQSFLSLIALICLMGGTFATALGLIKISEDPSGQFMTDEEYIVPAVVGNTLCVIFLVWLTATVTTRSTAYKFIVIIILILGIVGEIYMIFFFTKPPEVYGTYVLIVVNFLIRTFYVLEFVQDTWSPISWNDYSGYVAPSKSSSGEKKSEGESKPPTSDAEKQAKDKLKVAIEKIKADPKGIDGKSQNDAYVKLKDAIKAGKGADDAYKAGKAELKYKDGSAYTGAGRRRA